MFFTRRSRRLTAWLACFAILLASLAPSVSHAIGAAKGSVAIYGEICTVQGTKWIKVGDSQASKSSSPVQAGMHFEHCPFCCSHAGSVGLPPNTEFQFPVPIGGDSQPILFYHSPRPLFVWASAHSRAPPQA